MKIILIYGAFGWNHRISGTLLPLLEGNRNFSYFSRVIKRYSSKFGRWLGHALVLSPRAE
jgi:hypothetical protein